MKFADRVKIIFFTEYDKNLAVYENKILMNCRPNQNWQKSQHLQGSPLARQ